MGSPRAGSLGADRRATTSRRTERRTARRAPALAPRGRIAAAPGGSASELHASSFGETPSGSPSAPSAPRVTQPHGLCNESPSSGPSPWMRPLPAPPSFRRKPESSPVRHGGAGNLPGGPRCVQRGTGRGHPSQAARSLGRRAGIPVRGEPVEPRCPPPSPSMGAGRGEDDQANDSRTRPPQATHSPTTEESPAGTALPCGRGP